MEEASEGPWPQSSGVVGKLNTIQPVESCPTINYQSSGRFPLCRRMLRHYRVRAGQHCCCCTQELFSNYYPRDAWYPKGAGWGRELADPWLGVHAPASRMCLLHTDEDSAPLQEYLFVFLLYPDSSGRLFVAIRLPPLFHTAPQCRAISSRQWWSIIFGQGPDAREK